jgi:hypothetical protein
MVGKKITSINIETPQSSSLQTSPAASQRGSRSTTPLRSEPSSAEMMRVAKLFTGKSKAAAMKLSEM